MFGLSKSVVMAVIATEVSIAACVVTVGLHLAGMVAWWWPLAAACLTIACGLACILAAWRSVR